MATLFSCIRSLTPSMSAADSMGTLDTMTRNGPRSTRVGSPSGRTFDSAAALSNQPFTVSEFMNRCQWS